MRPIENFADGKRLNTREVQEKWELVQRRHEKIQAYSPAGDCLSPNLRIDHKIFIPQENPTIRDKIIGHLMDPEENTLEVLEAQTGAKISIRGRTMEMLSKRHGSLSGENEPLHVYVTSYDREALSRGCEKVRDIMALLIQDQEYELNTNGSEDPPAQNVLPWGMEAHFVSDSAERFSDCTESGCVAICFREDPASIAKKPAVFRERTNSVPGNPSRGIQHFCQGIDRHKSEAIQLCPEVIVRVKDAEKSRSVHEREKERIAERYPDYDQGTRRSGKKKEPAPSFRGPMSPRGEWEELSAVANNWKGEYKKGEDRFVVPSKSPPKGILRQQHRGAPSVKKRTRFTVEVEVHTVPNRSDEGA